MEASGCTKRAAAGRSGGMFDLLIDSAGIPSYQYQHGFGTNTGPIQIQQDVRQYEDTYDEGCQYGLLQDDESTDGTAGADSTSSFSCEDQSISCGHLGEENFQSTLMQARYIEEGFSSKSRGHKNQIWIRSSRILKDKISNIKHRVHTRWSKLKIFHDHEKNKLSDYSVDIQEQVDEDELVNERFFGRSLSQMPSYLDSYVESGSREFETGYTDTPQELFCTEAGFQIFCSFPDECEEWESNDGSYSKRQAATDSKDDSKSTIVESTGTTVSRDMRTHYEVLGLDSYCNTASITLRARHLMSTLHPDKTSLRTTEQKLVDAQEFARVSLAKTELLNAELRSLHNLEIELGMWTGVPYT